MTGFGYIVMVSGVDVDMIADHMGVGTDDIKIWCEEENLMPDEKLEVFNSMGIHKNVIIGNLANVGAYDEHRLYMAGVLLAAILHRDFRTGNDRELYQEKTI